MTKTLYLRRNEQLLFSLLSEDLKKTWQPSIVSETLESFEKPAEIEEQLRQLSFRGNAAAEAFRQNALQKMRAGEDISMDEFPNDAMPALLEAMGAGGISALIEVALAQGNLTDSDMESLIALSNLRHSILEKNAVAA